MSEVYDIAQEREACLQEYHRMLERLDQSKSLVRSYARKKTAMRAEGRSLKQVNKDLARATEERDGIKALLHDQVEKLRQFKKVRKATRNFADYFMDVCKRDFDQATFEYLKAEARKLSQECSESYKDESEL